MCCCWTVQLTVSGAHVSRGNAYISTQTVPNFIHLINLQTNWEVPCYLRFADDWSIWTAITTIVSTTIRTDGHLCIAIAGVWQAATVFYCWSKLRSAVVQVSNSSNSLHRSQDEMTFHLPEPGLFKKQNPPAWKTREFATMDGEGRGDDTAGYVAE